MGGIIAGPAKHCPAWLCDLPIALRSRPLNAQCEPDLLGWRSYEQSVCFDGLVLAPVFGFDVRVRANHRSAYEQAVDGRESRPSAASEQSADLHCGGSRQALRGHCERRLRDVRVEV